MIDKRNDADTRLALALTHFLDQESITGIHYSIDDAALFSSFQTFWSQAPEYVDHPALLGQFRVELVQRGYQATSEGKHPHWSGLTLRTSTSLNEGVPDK